MPKAPAKPRFNYQRYLASREWALLKEQVRDRCDGWCENCHAAPYQATHHLTYERIGQEDTEDLLAVCNDCHDWFSGKQGARNGCALNFLICEVLSYGGDHLIHFLLNLCRDEHLAPEFRFGDALYFRQCGGTNCEWCRATPGSIFDFTYEINRSLTRHRGGG